MIHKRFLALVAGAALLVGCATSPEDEPPTPQPPPSPTNGDDSPGEQEGVFPSASDCPPFTPQELPDGQEPGEAEPYPSDAPNDFQLVWGEGQEQVVVGWGQEVLDETGLGDDPFPPADLPDEQVVAAGGVERHVVPIGDPPQGQIAITFVDEPCPYVLWLAGGVSEDGEPLPGYELEEAIEYAERF